MVRSPSAIILRLNIPCVVTVTAHRFSLARFFHALVYSTLPAGLLYHLNDWTLEVGRTDNPPGKPPARGSMAG